jgi:hypothetical protein
MEASQAMFERLRNITFADLLVLAKKECKDKFLDYMISQSENRQDALSS